MNYKQMDKLYQTIVTYRIDTHAFTCTPTHQLTLAHHQQFQDEKRYHIIVNERMNNVVYTICQMEH